MAAYSYPRKLAIQNDSSHALNSGCFSHLGLCTFDTFPVLVIRILELDLLNQREPYIPVVVARARQQNR